jgi:hypothetical protein
MRRRSIALLVLTLMLGATLVAHSDTGQLPVPEGGVVQVVPGASCTPDSRYESAGYKDWYPGACKRLRVVFGPILAKAGQNDVLIQPVTFEKPMYDGYMIRLRPGLIDASGFAPPVESLHLHHGTWLNPNYAAGNPFANTPIADSNPFRAYGAGPWLATGEEKTIAAWPKGYGLNIKATDAWLFLHMVHNATFKPQVVWVTYDIDFVDASMVNKPGAPTMKNTKGVWLDVGGGKFHSKTETYPANPVYNVMRGYGSYDPETGRRVCAFPAQNCAAYNSLDHPSAQQGIDVTGQTGSNGLELKGMDYRIPFGFLGGTAASPGVGTLVVMGGHLHNGGIRDDVSLVRPTYKVDPVTGATTGNIDTSVTPEERLILISDGYYWNHANPDAIGGTPGSWDFAMTGSSKDIGWSINVREGDILRLNGLYDTELAAWWENMGIVMTWVAPGEQTGYDMFAKDANGNYLVNLDRRIPANASVPSQDPNTLPGGFGCQASATLLCVRGQVTHGHYASSDNHGDCGLSCPAFPSPKDPISGAPVLGPLVTDVHWGGFTFGETDFAAIAVAGVPRVMKGNALTFWNGDAGLYIPHTATSCAFPCSGATTVDYPISNGSFAQRQANGSYQIAGQIDFDSTELAYGLGPAGALSWKLDTATLSPGVYTFYCRIHPSMRGAFEVVTTA